jgi:hypothetical protein
MLRIGELLEGLDRPEEALDRYREALVLAFRLDRRASWVAARLAATRLLARFGLTDESMTHLESQIPPPAEVTIDVVVASSKPEMLAAAAAPLQEPFLPAETATARAGSFPDPAAPVSGAVSSSRITWPDPMAAPPPNAYPSNPEVPIADAAPSERRSGQRRTGDRPQLGPRRSGRRRGRCADRPAVGDHGGQRRAEPLAAPASPNPSDPGAESSPQGRLDLEPELGIGMAASADSNPRPTEATCSPRSIDLAHHEGHPHLHRDTPVCRVHTRSRSTLCSPPSYLRAILPLSVSTSPGQTFSFHRIRVRRTFAGPSQSVAQALSAPAWNIPTASGAG